jgi:hypothetical protein
MGVRGLVWIKSSLDITRQKSRKLPLFLGVKIFFTLKFEISVSRNI